MSGPKLDQATLERMERERLERERQERLRRIMKATTTSVELWQEAKDLVNIILSDHKSVISTLKEKPEMELLLRRVEKAKKTATDILTNLLNTALPPEPDEIENLNQLMKETIQKTKEEYAHKTDGEWERAKNYISKLEELKNHKGYTDIDLSRELVQNIVSFEIAEEYIEENEELDEEIRIKAKEALKEIEKIINSEFSSFTVRKSFTEYARTFINSAEESKEALYNTLVEFNISKQTVKRDLQECEALYQEYVGEYVLYINLVNEPRAKKLEIAPKSRSNFWSKQALKDEIEEIRKASIEANEQNYIRSQIDEVMKLFKYNMCEDIVFDEKQSGQHFISESIDGNNAIHFYISDTKQVMMEIVGTGTAQMPENATVSAAMETATGSDVEKLFSEQGQFCSMHPKITEELRKRGVILNEVKHQKSDRKYSKKIIRYRTVVSQRAPKFYHFPKKRQMAQLMK